MAKKLSKYKLLERCYKINKGKCHYCGVQTRVGKHHHGESKGSNFATLEHILPKSKGGTDAKENLTLACYTCNTERGNMDYHEFRALKGLPPVKHITGTAADKLPKIKPAPLIPFVHRL